MRISLSDFDGPRLLHPVRHEDHRGFFSETWAADRFREDGIEQSWVQDNHSASIAAGTLRGLHFQLPPHAQAKLVRVPKGAVYDVIVDLREGSPTFGAWSGVELSDSNWNQLFVPEGFAHGFCTLQPDTHVMYKVSAPYAPQAESGLRWDDPSLAIEWPKIGGRYVVTERDRAWPSLAQVQLPFTRERSTTRVPASTSGVAL